MSVRSVMTLSPDEGLMILFSRHLIKFVRGIITGKIRAS